MTNLSSGDGSLGLFVAKQTPNVRCYGSAAVRAIVNSCQSIMDRMDVSKEARTFGIGGTGVNVELPYTWRSGEEAALKVRHHCCVAKMKICSGSQVHHDSPDLWPIG